MDSSKIEELGPPMLDHSTRYRAKTIVKEYFEGIYFIEQAQLLNMLLKRKMSKKCSDIIGHSKCQRG